MDLRTLLIKFVALPLAGVVAFFVFLVVTFPEDRVQNLIKRSLEKSLDYEYRVDMVEFDFGFFSGIEMKNVSLDPRFEFEQLDTGGPGAAAAPAPAPSADAGNQGGEERPKYFCPDRIDPMPVMFDSISVDPSILALIGGNIEAEFAVEAAGGTISGGIASEEGGRTMTATIEDLTLQRFTLLRNWLEMHVIGRFNGDIDLGFDAEGAMSSGAIEIDMSDVVICPKKFPHPKVGFFELPLTQLGNLEGELEVTEKGRIEFGEFTGDGEDAGIQSISGYIQLATKQRPKSQFDLRIRAMMDPQWISEGGLGMLFNGCNRDANGALTLIVSNVGGKFRFDCVRGPGGAPPPTASARPTPRTRPTRSPSPRPTVREEPVDDVAVGNAQPAPTPPSAHSQRTERPLTDGRPSPANPEVLKKRGVAPVPVEQRKALMRNAYKK